jgi:putative endonuclease
MHRANRAKGQRSEQVAVDHLRANGWTILGVNWHCSAGEIDIIALRDELIAFVEVRGRSTTDAAFESISASKQRRMIQAAQMWLAAHELEEAAWRIDVIAVGVRGGRSAIEHQEDALGWS